MLDAAELAQSLTTNPHWDDAVAAYETRMFARVAESAEGSAEAAATFLSHDSEALSIDTHRSHQVPFAIGTDLRDA
jgi:hypothetical protein